MGNQKPRPLRYHFVLPLALVWLAMTLGCQQDQDRLRELQQTNQALAQQKQTLQQKNQALMQEIQKLKQENQAFAQRVQELEKEIQSLKQTIEAQKHAPAEKATTAREAAGQGLYHQVKRGETLYQIGQAYGVPYRELARINNIRDPNEIRVGQKLFIPEGTQQ